MAGKAEEGFYESKKQAGERTESSFVVAKKERKGKRMREMEGNERSSRRM